MKMEFLKANRFRTYLFLHLYVVVAVIMIFRLIIDRHTAAVTAGLLFILVPAYVMMKELKIGKAFTRPSVWGAAAFLLLSALPLFGLRLYYWNLPFEQINFLGFSGPELHKISNGIFILMLVGYFVDSFRENLKNSKGAE